MKPRLRTHAERRRVIRRHRMRHLAAMDTGSGADPGWVSATVLFTDTSRTGETPAWLEPDGRSDKTCGATQF